MIEQNKLDADALRNDLVEPFVLPKDIAQIRSRIASELSFQERDLDELLVAFGEKRGLTPESLNRITREHVRAVREELTRIAGRREIRGSPDKLAADDLPKLPALIIDAQQRWRQNSEALRQIRSGRTFTLQWGNWLLPIACILALITIISIFVFTLRPPVLVQIYPQEPTPAQMAVPPPLQQGLPEGPAKSSLIGAVLPASLISIASIVLLIAGVALFMSWKTPVGRGTAALLGLSGLSLFPIKDVKMFENAFKEIRPTLNLALTKPVVETQPARYVVGGFVEGTERLEPSPTSQDEECSEYIRKLVKNNELAFIIVVGHVDKRELKTESRRYYGGNSALAYRRAIVVRDRLLKAYSDRVIMLSGGPTHVGLSVGARDLANDRNVEVFPYSILVTRPSGGKSGGG